MCPIFALSLELFFRIFPLTFFVKAWIFELGVKLLISVFSWSIFNVISEVKNIPDLSQDSLFQRVWAAGEEWHLDGRLRLSADPVRPLWPELWGGIRLRLWLAGPSSVRLGGFKLDQARLSVQQKKQWDLLSSFQSFAAHTSAICRSLVYEAKRGILKVRNSACSSANCAWNEGENSRWYSAGVDGRISSFCFHQTDGVEERWAAGLTHSFVFSLWYFHHLSFLYHSTCSHFLISESGVLFDTRATDAAHWGAAWGESVLR